MDLVDLERRAAAALEPHVYDYIRATSGGPDVLAQQIAAWEAIRLRPRVLTGAGAPAAGTTVLGTPVASPVLVAPMAQQIDVHPDGERATARGTAAAGALLGVSTNTAVPFADIAAEGAPWWFQLYVMRERAVSAALLRRAADAGASAVLLTVDITRLRHPRPGSGVSVEPTEWTDGRTGRRLSNLTDDERRAIAGDGGRTDRSLGVGAIEWIRDVCGLPVVVKGVLRGDDAVRVVDAGAAGVVVSTHGGRGLSSSVGSATALPEVVAAVGHRAEVYADSGVRSGAHVAAALALGARAVFVGRPAMWGLAVDGAAGVEAVLRELREELLGAMDLLGVDRVDALARDLVHLP
ncbi:alpha-hydroxy acid oxidase [Amnibacterium sp.]|uniref:alpha-hydroxy acid oxidase n=1 Tax=Amnibacterium sp. TaxID=1872496 RepID=UPI003F7B3910